MAFKYSCFISYVHSGIPQPGSAVMRQFVDELEGLLAEELETQVDEPIFRDNEGLSGGDLIDPALGEALCGSAAWIVVYVPRYPKREYCRREFTAMQLLERQRLQALNGGLPQRESMIIPVVLRGDTVVLPPAEAGPRLYEDFKAYDSASNPLRTNEQYARKVRA